MSDYRFSERSLRHLEGVDPFLVRAAYRALEITEVDFGVIDGVRTLLEQAEMVDRGASTTMESRHLTGHAIDVMAFVNGKGRWEFPLYCHVAYAFKKAAQELGGELRWGGCWDMVSRLPDSAELIQRRVEDWVAARRAAGRRALVDAGHFEIPRGGF